MSIKEKELLKVIGTLQDLIGVAIGKHNDDKDRNGFEEGQRLLSRAFNICIETAGKYPRLD